jgi:hypothetical protein
MTKGTSQKDFHTLLVRIDPVQAKKLRMIAAYEDTSMSELVRFAIEGVIDGREEEKVYQELLSK